LTEIRGYTLAQFAAFSRAAAQQRRERLRDDAVNLRMAQYEWKDFMAYLKKIEESGDGR